MTDRCSEILRVFASKQIESIEVCVITGSVVREYTKFDSLVGYRDQPVKRLMQLVTLTVGWSDLMSHVTVGLDDSELSGPVLELHLAKFSAQQLDGIDTD